MEGAIVGGLISFFFSNASILDSYCVASFYSSLNMGYCVVLKAIAVNALIMFLFPLTYVLYLFTFRQINMAGFISHILLEEFVSLPDSFTPFFFFPCCT